MKERILIVDDERDICEILSFNLENEGYEVDTASSAEEALQKFTPDHKLILLDVMMGGMSGYRLAEKLRKEGNIVPIVFLTAKDTENDMLTEKPSKKLFSWREQPKSKPRLKQRKARKR